MDGPGARRALRESSVLGVVLVVLLLSAVVLGGALVGPWVHGVGESTDTVCMGEAPQAVLDDWSATGSEGSLGAASSSWLPYGPRCTWQVSGSRTIAKDPSWDATLAALGALAVAGSALALLVRRARRSQLP